MALEFYKNLYTSKGVQVVVEVLEHVPVRVTTAMSSILMAPYDVK